METEEPLISLQLTVDKICSVIAEKTDVTFSHEFINNLTALAFQTIGDTSQKLTYFAKHAKRSLITKDDVNLYFRCSQQMLAVIEGFSDITYESDTESIEYVVGKTSTSHATKNGTKLEGKPETLIDSRPRRTRKCVNYEEKSLSASYESDNHLEDAKRPLAQSKRSLKFSRNAKKSVNYHEESSFNSLDERD